jgi:hypothetical protein
MQAPHHQESAKSKSAYAHVQLMRSARPYHADVIAIEQNLGQLGVVPRVVAGQFTLAKP